MSKALEIAQRNAVESRATATLKMRDQFPATATIVDELRAEGFAPRVRFVEEDGRRQGYRGNVGVTYAGTGRELVSKRRLRKIADLV